MTTETNLTRQNKFSPFDHKYGRILKTARGGRVIFDSGGFCVCGKSLYESDLIRFR